MPTWGKSVQQLVTCAHCSEMSQFISGREAFPSKSILFASLSLPSGIYCLRSFMSFAAKLLRRGGLLSAIWRAWWDKCSTCDAKQWVLSLFYLPSIIFWAYNPDLPEASYRRMLAALSHLLTQCTHSALWGFFSHSGHAVYQSLIGVYLNESPGGGY